ncbi:MAG: NAD(P)H-hydrate epimerase, partial [Caldimonas sp.]
MSTIRPIDAADCREALFSVASARRIEGEALRDVPAFTLMARAGEAVARLALALAPHAKRMLVVAGPGNNGGDGIEAATRLREFGKDASVLLVADPAALPAEAAQALARARRAGVRIDTAPAEAVAAAEPPGLVIDALLGIGASRPPSGEIAAAIGRIA